MRNNERLVVLLKDTLTDSLTDIFEQEPYLCKCGACNEGLSFDCSFDSDGDMILKVEPCLQKAAKKAVTPSEEDTVKCQMREISSALNDLRSQLQMLQDDQETLARKVIIG